MSKTNKCKLCDITPMENPGTCWKCVAAGFRSYKEVGLFEFEVEGREPLPRVSKTKSLVPKAAVVEDRPIKTDASKGVRCKTIDGFLKEGKSIPEVVTAMLALFPDLEEKRVKQLAHIRRSRMKGQLPN